MPACYDLGQQAADLGAEHRRELLAVPASLRQLEIAKQSENPGRQYVQAVATLVDADRLPRSEVNQAQANFDSRAAGRLRLEQQVVEARSALALAMGLPADQIASAARARRRVSGRPGRGAALERARRRAGPGRPGPDAARRLPRPARRVERRARCGARPPPTAAPADRRHDQQRATPACGPVAAPGTSWARPSSESQGGDAFVGVRWSRPWANTTALGEIAEAEAAYQQAVWLRTERGARDCRRRVNAVAALQTGFLRLGKARAAVTGFRAALDGEQDKLRLGAGLDHRPADGGGTAERRPAGPGRRAAGVRRGRRAAALRQRHAARRRGDRGPRRATSSSGRRPGRRSQT